jgi:hypothetical protein
MPESMRYLLVDYPFLHQAWHEVLSHGCTPPPLAHRSVMNSRPGGVLRFTSPMRVSGVVSFGRHANYMADLEA